MDFSTLLAVRDLMSKEMVTTDDTATVIEMAKTMAERNVSSVVIVNHGDGRVVGIVTEADVVRKGVATGLDLGATAASAIMNTQVQKVDGGASIFDARDTMKKAGVRHMIVEEEGKPVGIISSTALLGS
ncbi:MAG: CBS domain-containing protein [Nitrospinae bacterium]|nr:CBS domain-containing protein [Nitrospinota bacterium]